MYRYMSKQIMIKDQLAKKLDEIRKQFNCSYSEAIEILCKGTSEIDRINEYFEMLKRETTIKPEILEYMRVITIQFAKGRNGSAAKLLKELAEKGAK